MDKVNADTILGYLKELVESKRPVAKEEWLNCAFKLNLLRIDESQLLSKMRQAVKLKELAIYNAQDKKNRGAAELEIESTDEYRFYRDQSDKLEIISEFIRIAKKNSDETY